MHALHMQVKEHRSLCDCLSPMMLVCARRSGLNSSLDCIVTFLTVLVFHVALNWSIFVNVVKRVGVS